MKKGGGGGYPIFYRRPGWGIPPLALSCNAPARGIPKRFLHSSLHVYFLGLFKFLYLPTIWILNMLSNFLITISLKPEIVETFDISNFYYSSLSLNKSSIYILQH